MRAHAAAALHIVTNATIQLSRIPYSDKEVILKHGHSTAICLIKRIEISFTNTYPIHQLDVYPYFIRKIALQGDTHNLTEGLGARVDNRCCY